MITFLNGFGALVGVTLLLAIGGGYLTPGVIDLNTHVLIGLVGALGGILCLSLVMFYFIGTGSVAKKAAIASLLSPEEYRRTRKMKGVLFPILMGGVAVLMVTPMLGAGYHAGKMELTWHHAMAWLSLVATLGALWKARGMMTENRVIFDKSLTAVNEEAERRQQTGEEPMDLN
ncbi:MAG: hypothetical protein HQK87_08860 [Nitrospinae bacterium]|nr:hypothetical protein [Nitrospinota bacterium]